MKTSRRIERFTLKLKAITPFLVASGRKLRPFDYVLAHQPRTGTALIRVIDFERLIQDPKVAVEKKLEVMERRAGWSLDRYFRYTLSCDFRPVEDKLEIVECFRDDSGAPCLPASSLKGSIRTALAYCLLKEKPELLRKELESMGFRREWVGRQIEERLFGKDIGRSPLQVLRLSDPTPGHFDDVKVYEVGLLNQGKFGFRKKYSIYVEAWSPEVDVAVPVSLDTSRMFRNASPVLREAFSSRTGILRTLQDFSRALVEAERKFYATVSPRELAPLWEEVVQRGEGKPLLPFGYGTGWHTKTLGMLLGRDDFTKRLKGVLSPDRRFVEMSERILFPKTRRWILQRGRPATPLGWVTWE